MGNEYNYDDLVRDEEEKPVTPQAQPEDAANAFMSKVENIVTALPEIISQAKAAKDEIGAAALAKAGGGVNKDSAEKIKGIQATMIKQFTKDREKLLKYIIILLDELSTKFGDQKVKEIMDTKGKIKEVVLVRDALKELITYMNAEQNRTMVINTIDQRLAILGV